MAMQLCTEVGYLLFSLPGEIGRVWCNRISFVLSSPINLQENTLKLSYIAYEFLQFSYVCISSGGY